MATTPRQGSPIPTPPENPSEGDMRKWAKSLSSVLGAEINRLWRELSLQSIATVARFVALRGRDILPGDFDLTTGVGVWATTPPTPVVSGNDQRFQIEITAAATTIAAPGWTLTFRDGAWPTAPFAVVVRNDDQQPGAFVLMTYTTTTTTMVFNFHGLPVAGRTYKFSVHLFG